MVVAAVAMIDSRAGITVAAGQTSFPPGFYPFWSATLVFVSSAIWLVRTARKDLPAAGHYATPEDREGLRNVAKVALPMIAAAVLILWLGIYIVAALYLAFFGWYVGRYRWRWILPTALVTPVVLFYLFERFFLVSLPKSFLYGQGVLPF